MLICRMRPAGRRVRCPVRGLRVSFLPACPTGSSTGSVFRASPSQALVPASAAVRTMASEPGVWMLVPGAGPDGAMGAVRVPIADYGESSGQAGFFARMLAVARYFLIGFAILVVLSGLAYLGSSAVANRYREYRARPSSTGAVGMRGGAGGVAPRRCRYISNGRNARLVHRYL